MQMIYRVKQTWQSIFVRPTPSDVKETSHYLSPQLFDLFSKQQPADQAHAIDVYHKLKSAGFLNDDLLTAALLHDVGKSRYPLRTWERIAAVIGNKIAPAYTTGLSSDRTSIWYRSFNAAKNHPEWGAEMVSRCGATPVTVEIIRFHQTPDIQAQFDPHGRSSFDKINTPEFIELVLVLQKFDNQS